MKHTGYILRNKYFLLSYLVMSSDHSLLEVILLTQSYRKRIDFSQHFLQHFLKDKWSMSLTKLRRSDFM